MILLASDFDETIYVMNDPDTTRKNAEALQKFVKAGNSVCVTTGRNYSGLKQLLIQNNIPYTYLICEDGAKLFNNMDYCIDTTMLDRKDVEEIIPILESYHYDFYLDDGYNRTNNYDDCVKIVVNCINEEEKKKIVETVKSKVNVHIYASRFHVNIIHKSVNKEVALKKLFNLEKLDFNSLRVVGDNDNDYEMLKAFEGVVMKNHHPVLDELNKKEYNALYEYVEDLMKN